MALCAQNTARAHRFKAIIFTLATLLLPTACAAEQTLILDITLTGLPADRPDQTTASLTYRATRCIWLVSCEPNFLGGSPLMKTYTRDLPFTQDGASRILKESVEVAAGGLGAYVLETIQIQSDAEAKPSWYARVPINSDPAPEEDVRISAHVLDSRLQDAVPQDRWPERLTLDIDHGPIYIASSSPSLVKDPHVKKWGWRPGEDGAWLHEASGAHRRANPQTVTLPVGVDVPIPYAFTIGSRYWSEPDQALLEQTRRFTVLLTKDELAALGLPTEVKTTTPSYLARDAFDKLHDSQSPPGAQCRLEPEQAVWVKLDASPPEPLYLVTGGLAPNARWMAVDVVKITSMPQ